MMMKTRMKTSAGGEARKGEEEACMAEKDITDDETRNLFDKIDDFFEINQN